jgi:hypothetical protein
MYNPVRIMAQMWKESDAEGKRDMLEGFIGMACLCALCFMLMGVC